jgi:hypothetical protein
MNKKLVLQVGSSKDSGIHKLYELHCTKILQQKFTNA